MPELTKIQALLKQKEVWSLITNFDVIAWINNLPPDLGDSLAEGLKDSEPHIIAARCNDLYAASHREKNQTPQPDPTPKPTAPPSAPTPPTQTASPKRPSLPRFDMPSRPSSTSQPGGNSTQINGSGSAKKGNSPPSKLAIEFTRLTKKPIYLVLGGIVLVVLVLIALLAANAGGQKTPSSLPDSGNDSYSLPSYSDTPVPTTTPPDLWDESSIHQTVDPAATTGVANPGEWSIILRVIIGVVFGLLIDVYQTIWGRSKGRFSWLESLVSISAAILFVLYTFGANWKITSLINPFTENGRYEFSTIMAVVCLIISGLATRDPSRPGSALVISGFLYVLPTKITPGLLGYYFGENSLVYSLKSIASRMSQGAGDWGYSIVIGSMFAVGCILIMIDMAMKQKAVLRKTIGQNIPGKESDTVIAISLAVALAIGLWLLPAINGGNSLIAQLALVIIGMVAYYFSGEKGDEAIVFGFGLSTGLTLLIPV